MVRPRPTLALFLGAGLLVLLCIASSRIFWGNDGYLEGRGGKGKVLVWSDLPWGTVSHDRSIKKKVILENGLVPHLTGFHRSVFKHGQVAPAHSHGDMHEVFYVEEGSGTFIINGKRVPVVPKTTVYLAPGDIHEVVNDSPDGKDMVLVYFGVVP